MVNFNEFLLFIDGYLSGSWWFPAFLIGTGLFFTIYLRFPQFRYFKHGWRILSGKFVKDSTKGETTPFQALSTALSGTVGTGNIGGVALAIWIGGPAAIFWMWITAIFGMTTKFVEVTLAHKYRRILPDGTVSGGPMYFIEEGLNMKWLAITFSALMMITALGSGNMPQINNIANVMESTFTIPKFATGLVLAVLLWMVIIGGIKRIALIASKLVPTMGFIYIAASMVIIFDNYENIVPSITSIFSQVFTGSSALGGFLGASFAMSLKYGVARGLYSNEAGQGSSPIAHASSKTENPIEEGMVSILEPFIDTIVVCTITALVILSSGVWTEKFENDFDRTSTHIINGIYDESVPDDVRQLQSYLYNQTSNVIPYTGELDIVNGVLVNKNITILHKNSIAENVFFHNTDGLHSGNVDITSGKVAVSGISLSGKSLIHSAELTAKAFSSGVLGKYGEYIVAIGLLLFAFSTVIAWSYYGDRSTAYIFGERGVIWYRVLYVFCFFLASIIDTEVVWNIAYVVVALVTIPNLIAVIVLRKEIKSLSDEYKI
ncbi:sodium:alanine symporter family protein [Gammaproteobacteria bacterium]|nr:sodium:alanine symporter family protein [Gammaproteobacteria bacterium]MDA7802692.1 sodium:alanine symporter family protein [Gammaproteobacteria bacterium]MDA9010917.1 sodium:alanine symporter family protein [Gammaproteobacteria bacterium]MDA9045302.1 sodium:alanine symporter family protein [Gammaproteobacteria bacterium]MDA9118355.1 sodium:alanine symporter family protein [Gammaproteobacteria bacterium]